MIKLKITKHANDQMIERGITSDQIKRAIKQGSKYKQTGGLLAVHTYIEVAYKIIDRDLYKIKTVKIKK